jgi:hypothetical protein
MADTQTPTKSKQGDRTTSDAAAQQDVELSPTNLTWLGEEGDAKPGKKLMIVKDKDGRWGLRETAVGDEQVVVPGIRITTPLDTTAATDHIAKVVCTTTKGSSVELKSDEQFDSVFWTPSSVRKFVWPYYQSHRLWDDEIQAVKDKFETDPNAFAIAHQAPSRSSVRPGSPAAGLLVGRVVMPRAAAAPAGAAAAAAPAAPTFEFVPALQYI